MNVRKLALVTGSGKARVGSAVAEALAEAGFDIAIHYRTSETEARESADALAVFGIRAEVYRADLTVEAEVKGLIARVTVDFGRIDVLVNCAAIWERKPLEEVTADDVRRHFEVNTLGTFLCAQLAGLHMVLQPTGGVIVNFGDWADVRPYGGYAAYFPSKAAIPGLTRSLAVELGTRNPNVRVNAILPGPVMLPADLPEAERREAIDATLVKREGSPQHVADAVLFLVRNDFVTGVCLPVDGGRSVYAPG